VANLTRTYKIGLSNQFLLVDAEATSGFMFLREFDDNIKDLEVNSGEYFGKLAALVEFVRKGEAKTGTHNELLRKVRNELIYLKDNYKIVKQ